MKKFFLITLAILVPFANGFSKEKAPIGDGMGLAAASSWMIDNHYAPTCFDRAQFVGISKTYSANSRVTDSAASGTAMACGIKTDNSMLGQLPDGTPLYSNRYLACWNGRIDRFHPENRDSWGQAILTAVYTGN